jgi:hypothetical protein
MLGLPLVLGIERAGSTRLSQNAAAVNVDEPTPAA